MSCLEFEFEVLFHDIQVDELEWNHNADFLQYDYHNYLGYDDSQINGIQYNTIGERTGSSDGNIISLIAATVSKSTSFA